MTICSSIMQVFSLLFQGLSQGAQPIVSFNYGARNPERVRRAGWVRPARCSSARHCGRAPKPFSN